MWIKNGQYTTNGAILGKNGVIIKTPTEQDYLDNGWVWEDIDVPTPEEVDTPQPLSLDERVRLLENQFLMELL